MSSLSSFSLEIEKISNYIRCNQGITKKELYKWFGTVGNYSTLRSTLWKCIEQKNHFYFHSLSKRIYFYEKDQYVVGRFFLNKKTRSAYVVNIIGPNSRKMYSCKRPTIIVQPHDLVLINRGNDNQYTVVQLVFASRQWISGTVRRTPIGDWVIDVHSFVLNEAVTLQNAQDFKLQNGAIVSITQLMKIRGRWVAKIVAVISNEQSPTNVVTELCEKYGIHHSFSKEVMIEANKLVDNQERFAKFKGRIDLTGHCFVTIDGDNSKDLDDAICVSRSSPTTYNLKVAIADVSNYVTFGDLLDKEAQQRACSNYFLNIVHPMLPQRLSNDICSLDCGKLKLVLVCDIDYSCASNKILKYDVYHATIKSRKRFTYNQVNKILDKSNTRVDYFSNFIHECQLLSGIISAKFASQQQFKIESNELNISVNIDNSVNNIELACHGESEKIIENFMLMANYCIAKFSQKHKLNGIYRRHEPIQQQKLLQLWLVLKNLFALEFNQQFTEKTVASEIFNTLCNKKEFIESHKIALILVFSFYERAYYSEFCGEHFGIGVKHYCHFTSPIRRYADLYLHYAIAQFLYSKIEVFPKVVKKQSLASDLSELCFELNSSMQLASYCERDFRKIKQAEFLKMQPPETIYKGLITNIYNNRVYIQASVFTGAILPHDLSDDYLFEDVTLKQLIGQTTGIKYQLGDFLNVIPKFINVNTGSVFWKTCKIFR